MSEANKHDTGKLRWDLLPPDAMEDVVVGEMVAKIPGYEMYFATSMGRIFSAHKNRIIIPHTIWSGYLRIRLNGKNLLVHRLVLAAFTGEFQPYANHKNGIKTDNRLENLEWCTKSENTIHAYRTGLKRAKKGEETYNAIFTSREVQVIRGLYRMGATQAEIGELFGVRQANISAIVNRKCYGDVE